MARRTPHGHTATDTPTPSTPAGTPQAPAPPSPRERTVIIKPLNQSIATFHIQGGAPYMQLRFSEKARSKMAETQKQGSQARSRRSREARDFEDDFLQAGHRFPDGGYGIPAAAFRNAMIDVCRVTDLKMTIAKLCLFVEADGYDMVDGQPLVRIVGEPEPSIMPVRNASGVADLRVRPRWMHWTCDLRVRFDEDALSLSDVYNLLVRAGAQNGIGEGRPNSRESYGIGYGLFMVGTE